MATEYRYSIGQLDCYIDKDNMKDLVQSVAWSYWAKTPTTNPNQATGNEIQVSIQEVSYFEVPNPDDFIPFDELTKEIVWGWVESKIDLDQIKSNLDEQIEKIKNPTKEIKYLN